MITTLQFEHSLLAQVQQQFSQADTFLPFLASHKLIPHLLREHLIDQAIADITCTPEETAEACQHFYQLWGLTTELQQANWRSHYRLTPDQVAQLATRELRLQKFQQLQWGHKLETYFLKHKSKYDQAIYSLIRTQDLALASELYFRIQEGEQSFAELAKTYSEGQEAATGGIVGPVALGTVHPQLTKLLETLPEGELHPPLPMGGWHVIVRVEKKLPACLDNAMRQRLLKERFETWVQEQLQQLSESDQIWMGIKPELQAA
jgi:parvulin-like peptidyl-prolyl isomerase